MGVGSSGSTAPAGEPAPNAGRVVAAGGGRRGRVPLPAPPGLRDPAVPTRPLALAGAATPGRALRPGCTGDGTGLTAGGGADWADADVTGWGAPGTGTRCVAAAAASSSGQAVDALRAGLSASWPVAPSVGAADRSAGSPPNAAGRKRWRRPLAMTDCTQVQNEAQDPKLQSSCSGCGHLGWLQAAVAAAVAARGGTPNACAR